MSTAIKDTKRITVKTLQTMADKGEKRYGGILNHTADNS